MNLYPLKMENEARNFSRKLATVMLRYLYINYTHRRQWFSAGQIGVATSKADLHMKKVILSVWWGVSGIIHGKVLSYGCVITVDLYCQQLDRAAEKTQGKVGSNLLFA